jgi:hypothetical protein
MCDAGRYVIHLVESMSSLLVDALKDPTRLLIELSPPDDDFPARVTQYFSDIFKDADALLEASPGTCDVSKIFDRGTRIIDTYTGCIKPALVAR